MAFSVSSNLMDAVVLAVVARDGTYGYKITQDVRSVMELSESTLYPVLRRLQKDSFLETYDQEFQGRNRRYYRITDKGRVQLKLYLLEWDQYKTRLDSIFHGGIENEQI
ncbi:MAG: PadR family transcriptional regulator [Angelakisella sp.]